jgi:Rod binding domain-containing protein
MDGLSLPGLPASAELAQLRAQTEPMPRLGTEHAAAAEQFESLIATMLVKEMRQSLSDGFFGTGPGADTFAGWLDKSIGDSLAQTWQLDLAGMVKTNLDAKQARLDAGGATAPGELR